KRLEIATTVSIPDRKLIGTGVLQGDFVAACRLLCSNRRIRIELPHHNVSACIFQRRAGPAADAIEKIIIADLDQADRSKRLDNESGGGGNADHAIAVQILVEAGLQRLHFPYTTLFRSKRLEIATAVSIPDRKLIGTGVLQGDFVA